MPTLNKGRGRQRQREADDLNRRERMKIYNTARWRRMRVSQLMAQPLCQVCEGCGRTAPAVDVHHLQSFTGYEGAARRAMAFDYDNLVSLCKVCHQAAHHGFLKGAGSLSEMIERAAARQNLY